MEYGITETNWATANASTEYIRTRSTSLLKPSPTGPRRSSNEHRRLFFCAPHLTDHGTVSTWPLQNPIFILRSVWYELQEICVLYKEPGLLKHRQGCEFTRQNQTAVAGIGGPLVQLHVGEGAVHSARTNPCMAYVLGSLARNPSVGLLVLA